MMRVSLPALAIAGVLALIMPLIPASAQLRTDVRVGLQLEPQLADDFAGGFLFVYPKLMVQNAKLKGMWENQPAQSTDLTDVYWEE